MTAQQRIDQERICEKYGASWSEAPPHLKVGIALNVRAGLWPVNGLRHPPEGDTTGWYIWAGDFSTADDFFVPLHVAHLPQWCAAVMPFLGLPPGWRFLIAPNHEDVWYDPSLLNI